MYCRTANEKVYYEVVEFTIKQADTLPKVYKSFDMISDYLESYTVGYRAYRALFDLAMEKYREIKNEI